MTKQWFEVWFDSPYYEKLYSQRNETEAREFIDALLGFLNPKSDASMLDLGCGKGRHAIYLASKGFDVTGVDLSRSNIEWATKAEHKNLQFFVHDMRRLFRVNYFDFVFNFFTSFGYFEREEDHYKTIEAVANALKPDGVFVLDFLNTETVVRQLPFHDSIEKEGIIFNIHKHLQNGWIVKEIDVNDNGRISSFSEKVKALSVSDLKKYFEKAGLQITDTFGNYQLAPFDSNTSDRLILIGKKSS